MVQPSFSYIYEEIIPPKPLAVLLSLNIEERHLLAELGYRAKTFSPILGKALTARIQEFTDLNTGCPLVSADVQLYLQDWFLQLFQCREDKYIEFQEYFLPIPINLVIIGIDIILAHGHKVTQFSLNPERATEAFYKALAIKIANDQLQTQMEVSQHFSELILLD